MREHHLVAAQQHLDVRVPPVWFGKKRLEVF
jgi:hypothetical protein